MVDFKFIYSDYGFIKMKYGFIHKFLAVLAIPAIDPQEFVIEYCTKENQISDYPNLSLIKKTTSLSNTFKTSVINVSCPSFTKIKLASF